MLGPTTRLPATGTRHRARAVLLGVVVCALLLAHTANAGPATEPVYVTDPGSIGGPPNLGVLGHRTDDVVTIGFADPNYIVTSPNGVVSPDCAIESGTRAVCFRYGPGLAVFMRDGDDHVDLNSTAVRGYSIQGRGGNDTLLGSPARNILLGGHGRDRLEGARGRDLLVGGPGVDQMWGQRGKDTLNAIDGRRDGIIDCGPGGNDVARIDRNLDPKPRNCERVRYK